MEPISEGSEWIREELTFLAGGLVESGLSECMVEAG